MEKVLGNILGKIFRKIFGTIESPPMDSQDEEESEDIVQESPAPHVEDPIPDEPEPRRKGVQNALSEDLSGQKGVEGGSINHDVLNHAYNQYGL